MIQELHPAQKQIVKDRHRFRTVNAGRKFGKSSLGAQEIYGKALSKDGVQILYVAPTFGEARDIMWEPLKKLTRPAWSQEPNETRQEMRLVTQDDGSSVVFLKGWEAIESVRGMEFDFVLLDEVRKFKNFWVGWHEVIRPTLTPRKGEGLFFSTPNGYDHWYDLCMLYKADQDYKYFHFRTADNPYIPVEEIEKARQELTDDEFAQEYEADFRKQIGLVYKEFNREIHVTDLIPQYRKERILGVDFGYTNPTGVSVIDIDQNDTYWITEEWYRTGKVNIEIIEYCKSKQPNVVYPDPAEPDRIEEMKRHGLNCRDVSKDIAAGINKVRELFKANKIKIHRSCINLISELESYKYPEGKEKSNMKEDPVKEKDHLLDSIRYALYTHAKVEVVTEARQWKPSFIR